MEIKILIFTDKNYEYQAEYLIKSLRYWNIKNTIIWYTIGFQSKNTFEDVICKYWEKDNLFESYNFYKPQIFLDALDNFGDDFLFLDSDIIIGKRFNIEFFRNNNDYPLLPIGNWNYPIRFGGHYSEIKIDKPDLVEIDWEGRFTQQGGVIYNEVVLMNYFGIKERTMTYVLTCLVSFSKKCRDFLEEWNSVVSNKWILSKGFEYLPFWEETAANIILWRRKVKENYGRIFVNTLFADVVHHVESNENIKDINIFGNENQYCQDSSKIQFYHGIKSKEELEKIKFI